MTDQDWTAPPKSDPVGKQGAEWKVDAPRDSHFDSGIYIYAVPSIGVIRKVATVERQEDADLIVSLYEKWRAE